MLSRFAISFAENATGPRTGLPSLFPYSFGCGRVHLRGGQFARRGAIPLSRRACPSIPPSVARITKREGGTRNPGVIQS
jgi:hypothetical protein